MRRSPIVDCPSVSNAVPVTPLSELEGASPSAVEEEMVRLFDEVRIPLLRYLSAFPLAICDSDDVIQEAFLSLLRNLQKGNKYQNLRGWLFRAVHHLALKKRQRSRKDPESTGSLASVEEFMIDPGLNPEDQLAFYQTQQRLLAVVRALPEQHRCCLYLRAEGLRYREIAEILGMSLGSVSLSLERSLALIARAAQR